MQRRNQRCKGTGRLPDKECVTGTTYLLHRLVELLLHALARESSEKWGARIDGAARRRIDRETEARGEANRSQGPQAILSHARIRVADRANQLSGEIGLTAEGVA